MARGVALIMAAFIFIKAIMDGKPIELYNGARMKRDFTYIDDIVEGVLRVCAKTSQPDPTWNSAAPAAGSSNAPYRVYNIGNHQPVQLLRFVEILELELGRKAEKRLLPMQPGDVPESFADVSDLTWDTGFCPNTPIETGLRRAVKWYRDYYKV